ncbi:hypothetical protein [Vulcaniibacterium tengchongense]|uniref:hypothetical protein n=1 Tax=Vulcaniibacterium tengchongense TaxID=1273429 RepID=UPI000F50B926|nr:hypothetical protein [Vulcaniibacterium tengchongense]
MDANGNVTANGDATYTYDGFNRLASATKDGTTTYYWVNALGRRTYRTRGSPNATGFICGVDGQLPAEYDWSRNAWRNYLRLGSELVGLVNSGDNQVYAVPTDHLGRPERVSHAAKANVCRANNYAFGRVVVQDGIGGLNLGFPGRYYDAESGIWQNGFRNYDASQLQRRLTCLVSCPGFPRRHVAARL